MKKVIPALFFCLLAVIGGLCWVVLGNPYYAASDRNEGDLLLPLAAETEEIFLQSESYRLKMTEEKGVWLADGYYADNMRAQSYLQALRSAVIVGKKEVSGKELAKIIVKTADGGETDIVLREYAGIESGRFVEIEGEGYIVSQNLLPPATRADFYRQPLFPLAGVKTERTENFSGDVNFLQSLQYAGATKKMPASAGCRSFSVTASNGLKLDCRICRTEKYYLADISLNTTVMPTKEASSFAVGNRYRYDGWHFFLYPADGKKLFADVTGN